MRNGDPNVHDGQPNVRSMAVKLQVAGGKPADILANSIEGFVARTPEELLAFLEAQLPDPATGQAGAGCGPPIPGKPSGREGLRRAIDGQADPRQLRPGDVPRGACLSLHGRRRVEPIRPLSLGAGGRRGVLSPEAGSQRGPNFLREELAERLARGPAAFRLTLQVAAAGDPTDDPTALWPADRPTAELGRLEIASISPTSAADEQRLIFDPANVPDGIELSADPILLARSPAYGVSYAGATPRHSP